MSAEETECTDFKINNGILEEYSGNSDNVVIPFGVRKIGKQAFLHQPKITSVFIPETCTDIEEEAFYECTNLRDINFPDSLRKIGEASFELCQSLRSISIPADVSDIPSSAFYNCTGLENIFVDKENKYFCSSDGVLFNHTMTVLICYPAGKTCSKYLIPDGVKSIDEYAFSCCRYLSEIIIPGSVNSIGLSAVSFMLNPGQAEFIGENNKIKKWVNDYL